MSKKALFSKNEWQMIADGPEWVFAALAAADGNVALTVKAKESKAFKKVVGDYSSSSAVVKEVVGDKLKPAKAIKSATLSDAEQALEEINDLLAAKLDQKEADGYRKFLKDVADAVAEAAGEGLLGTGKKLSKKEEKALVKIKAAVKSKRSKAAAAVKPKAKVTAPSRPSKKAPAPARPVKKKPVAVKPRPASGGKVDLRRAKDRAAAKEYVAEHKVVAGDTLGHISLKYYGSAAKAKWMAIYEENKGIIGDNPNRIIAGQVLKIPKLKD
ncbi:MAG: LysM peptidoglycan-binding domain-containing protein [Chloroflexota bacterium]